jgi:TRAP-type transport system periplasmic protein
LDSKGLVRKLRKRLTLESGARQGRLVVSMKLSRRIFVAGSGALATPMSAFHPPKAVAAEAYVLRLTVPAPITSSDGIAATKFALAVDRRSRGQLKIEVYPNGQLAREQGIVDALSTGVVDLQLVASGVLESAFPHYQILSLPFLFKDSATAFRVLDGPVGAEFFAELDTKGIMGLGWGTTGFRELETTSKAVTVPEDLKGLRIRIQNGPAFVAIFQALGAIPVTIDLTEIFTAVSQHTIDGVDVPLGGFIDQKLPSIMKHVAMLNHIFSIIPFMGSKRKIDLLPNNLQRIVKDEGKALSMFSRSYIAQQTVSYIQTLKQNGVAFTEVQYPAFRKAMEPVYAVLQARLGGDLIDRVTRASNAAARP